MLDDAWKRFALSALQRRERRTLQVPDHIEFIRVDFFVVFNDNDKYKNRRKFAKNFGLIPVVYFNFNQTVIFAISDKDLFAGFVSVLDRFINSGNEVHPSGTDYAIATIIKNFEFIDSSYIIHDTNGGDILLSLIDNTEEIRPTYNSIFKSLNEYLEQQLNEHAIQSFNTDNDRIVQVRGASQSVVKDIANNFDIVFKVLSIRVPTLRQNQYNQPELTWGLEIDPPPDRTVMIGVLDNGARAIEPLQSILLDKGLVSCQLNIVV